MKDQAADWLTSLPSFRKDDIHVLKDEFMRRHQMTRVEKWKQIADIWRRRQGPTEPVDDYIAAMQAAARRVKMTQSSLADAIIQGLHPDHPRFASRNTSTRPTRRRGNTGGNLAGSANIRSSTFCQLWSINIYR
jgi:hypothetical protein